MAHTSKVQKSENNVLIIGNGFDRQLGLKTDYVSFLDWVEEKGEYLEERFRDLLDKQSFFIDITENNYYDKLNRATENVSEKIRDSFQEHNHNKLKETNYVLSILKLHTPSIIKPLEKKSNFWFSYFNLMRKKQTILNFEFTDKVGDNGEWIDLETLIEANIVDKIDLRDPLERMNNKQKLSIFRFSKQILNFVEDDQKLYQKFWNDFEELKSLLAEYIEQQQAIFNKNKDSLVGKPFLEDRGFDKVINFNYTNFYSEIIKLITPINNQPFFTSFYNLHGTIEDQEKIVFGLDSFFKDETVKQELGGKSILENKLLGDKNLVKYTKIQQLLELQKDKPKFEIGVVDKLSILGHSIGEQDYNYFFSILDKNIDSIELEYLWYKYNDNNEYNNKRSGQEALFNMINAYEKYASKRVFHKMIFEGRIKFEEVFIPRIVD